MNCQQFTSLIVEVARGRMMDAAARDGATRHADACADCAARLTQEQNLTSALRTVAAGMKDLSAPARVEAELLAAFWENHAGSQATATKNAAPAPLTTHAHDTTDAPFALPPRDEMAAKRASSRRHARRTAFVATAVAASLALVALVTLYRQFTQTAPTREIATNVAPQADITPAPVAPVAPAFVNSSTPPAPSGVTERTKHDRPQPTQRAETQRTSPKFARRAPPRMIASQQVIDGGRAIFAPGEGESAANHAGGAAQSSEAESVTEFIPLQAGTPSATPLESGQLVRVQLPRAALASLGLPLNAERGNEPVKADVLLGNDGLARAIRFVR